MDENPQDFKIKPDLAALDLHLDLLLGSGCCGRLALRSFRHDAPGQPVLDAKDITVDDSNESRERARVEFRSMANEAAEHPSAVCAPIWTFLHPGNTARTEDVAAAPLFWADFDKGDPAAALARLEGLLGRAQLVVRTGGEAVTEDRAQPRLSVWWRLAEPAVGDDLPKLKRLMVGCTRLVGGDPTGATLAHPMRIAGSVHSKDPARRKVARIQTHRPDAPGIDLDEALDAVGFALDAAGLALDPEEAVYDGEVRTAETAADLLDLADVTPNDGPLDWSKFNRNGMAFYVASDGSDAGLEAFVRWAAKNSSAGTRTDDPRARWAAYRRSPPSRVGLSHLLKQAHRARPGYQLPSEIEHARYGAEVTERLMASFRTRVARAAETGRIDPDLEEPAVGGQGGQGEQPDQDAKPEAEAEAKSEAGPWRFLPRPEVDPLKAGGLIEAAMRDCLAGSHRPQPQLALGAAISLVGALAGRRFIGPTNVAPNTYIGLLAPSTAGKEQPATYISQVLMEAGHGGLLGGRDITSDGAMERLAFANPTRLLIFDELARVLKPMLSDSDRNQISASAATWLMSVYTKTGSVLLGKEYADPGRSFGSGSDTGRRDIIAPCVSVLGSTNEVGLWEHAGESAMRNGFIGRWLFFAAPDTIPRPVKVKSFCPSPDVIERAKAVREAVAGHDYGMGADNATLMPKLYRVPIDPDAEEWIDRLAEAQVDYQNSLPKGDLSVSMFGRLVEQTHKLALVHAVSRRPGDPLIDLASVKWAYAVAVTSTQLICDRIKFDVHNNPFDREAKRAIRFIRSAGGRIDHSRLLKNMSIKAADLREITEYLFASGQVDRINQGGKTFYHLIKCNY